MMQDMLGWILAAGALLMNALIWGYKQLWGGQKERVQENSDSINELRNYVEETERDSLEGQGKIHTRLNSFEKEFARKAEIERIEQRMDKGFDQIRRDIRDTYEASTDRIINMLRRGHPD